MGVLFFLGIAGVCIAFGLLISPGSEAGADLTGPSGLEQIVSSKSYECPEGSSDSSGNCRYFATNILSLDVDRHGNSQCNFWLAETESVEDQGFVMSLGRSSIVWGVSLRNTHNSWARDRAMKTFRALGGVACRRTGRQQEAESTPGSTAHVRQPRKCE